jgi:hypothetical protein
MNALIELSIGIWTKTTCGKKTTVDENPSDAPEVMIQDFLFSS